MRVNVNGSPRSIYATTPCLIMAALRQSIRSNRRAKIRTNCNTG
ncbi:MAG: hypothetical protein VB140_07880 [Burkholderia sp.]